MLGSCVRVLCIFSICWVHTVCARGRSDTILYLTPSDQVNLVEETVSIVNIYGEARSNLTQYVYVEIQNEEIASVENSTGHVISSFCDGPELNTNSTSTLSSNLPTHCFNLSFSLKGLFLGRTQLTFYGSYSLVDAGNGGDVILSGYKVIVVRPESPLNDLFSWLLLGVLVVQNIAFGLTIDVREMVKLLKRPIAPAIGLCCQFIINPLTAYGLIKILDLPPSLAIGLFAMGCCPGGGPSNTWSYLHGGDMDLSILMTLVSTIAAFGLMPLWLYTLGRTITDNSVTIPFVNIITSLLALVIPCILGVLIKRFFPKAPKIILKIFKPLLVLLILSVAVVMLISNLFLFKMMKDWRIPVSGLSLPYMGYIVGACVAWITRQPWKRIKTIAIEVAFQNLTVAIVLLRFSLPQPDKDLSFVIPVVAAMFTPMPMWISFAILTVWRRCCKRRNDDTDDEEKKTKEKTPEGEDTEEKGQNEDGRGKQLDTHVSKFSSA